MKERETLHFVNENRNIKMDANIFENFQHSVHQQEDETKIHVFIVLGASVILYAFILFNANNRSNYCLFKHDLLLHYFSSRVKTTSF